MYSAKRDQVGMQQFSADMRLIDRTEVDPGRLRAMAGAGASSPGRQLFTQLRQAIEQGDLTLVYQPKFELSTGHIAGVEALVRWPHPIRGVLAPDAFLPLARENGLMGALTEMVLTRAADDAAAWRAQGHDVSFAVNLFPLSLTDPRLAPQIMRILKERAVPAESLTVEITEEIRLGNLDDTRSELQRLRESGVRISLDDFGCGYSGLSYLGELRVDELKLDRQFRLAHPGSGAREGHRSLGHRDGACARDHLRRRRCGGCGDRTTARTVRLRHDSRELLQPPGSCRAGTHALAGGRA
jgi:EAL domain-containing protein (putative c-di-GMP-specific phosphodiesterase class I)